MITLDVVLASYKNYHLDKPRFHNLKCVASYLWQEFSSLTSDNTETLSHGFCGNESQVQEYAYSCSVGGDLSGNHVHISW